MPIHEIVGEIVVEAAGQVAMEAGGETIHKRFGWKGCVLAVVIVVALVALAIWYFTA